MKAFLVVAACVVAVAVVPAAGLAAGADPNARAVFVSPITVAGTKATLNVRYRCTTGEHLWVSAKETRRGYSATKLMKEGSSRTASAWWDSHRNRFVCNGRFHTGTFTIDKVEKGKKGTLVDGSAWVQFCVTTGRTEADTVLTLSKSGWVRVNA
ncbi:MAG TPA: hypothetical protein VFA56_05110 [Gaiellaceae bacterium]|nr:hypothetical protein [Gaiellaceae bacterium]